MPSSQPSPAAAAATPAIPFAKNTTEYQTYVKLRKLVAARKPEQKPRILVYTDIDQDYDDLLAIIFLAEMHRMGAIELAGCVANHHPVDQRAMFLKTVLQLLGLPNVPVGKGTYGVQDRTAYAGDLFYGLKNTTFIDMAKDASFEPGSTLIKRLAAKTGESAGDGKPVTPPLTVLLLSTLQDIGEFFDTQKENPNFLRTNFDKFISQGGYTISPTGGLAACMDMTNNQFHPAQTANYTSRLASLNLRSDAWSREAAKAARMPGRFIQDLFPLGPIGKHLSWQWMRQEFKFFWDPLNIPFMEHLNVDWYLNTRLGLAVNSPEFNQLKASQLTFLGVAPKIKTIAYDCCAAVGAVGDDFMRAMGILAAADRLPAYNRAPSHNHRVFGDKPTDLGGIRAAPLARTMEAFLRGSLLATRDAAEALVCSAAVRHSAATYRMSLALFDEQVLPPLRTYRAHQARARVLARKTEGAEDAAGRAQLAAQAREETGRAAAQMAVLMPLVRAAGLTEVPGPEEIPYELMYGAVESQVERVVQKEK
ncbi:hypothetical protein BT67DRAFT_376443 [Trichocladium antarcticum]|uniref:Inosine/uridine-preferring nucleoside hydrolase domain-containing protein n=1 Tax=Trichocladium antarcticum TaxID=1450529 RepID=A0AAN6UMJ7_9PEZI|nr:hypothetical protein BT67DRAFT_376443 [Trichocladium antarcticum]